MITAVKNPHLVPLLLFALVPLLLHILDRRRARAVHWPAMRFLVPRDARRARRIRRREVLLLLARTTLALLAAAAFLRPVTPVETAGVAPRSAPRDIVIVLDVSFSMAYREAEGSPTALDRARDGALDELDQTAPGSRAAVLALPAGPVDPAAEPRQERWAPSIEAARRDARDAALRGGAFHLAGALDRAAEVLAQRGDAAAEVLIFTDLQRSALSGLDAARLRFLRDRLAPAPRIRIADCGAGEPVNRFVSRLEPEALAAFVDQPFGLEVRVESSGSPPGPEPLEIHILDEAAGGEAIELAAGADGAFAATVARQVSAAGDARLAARLPHDGLAADNSRRVVVEVFDRLPVTIIGDAGTGKYIDLALAPRARQGAAPALPFRPHLARGISNGDLDGAAVVVITALDRLDGEQARTLEAFVRRGGGLLIFCGSRVQPQVLTDRLHRSGHGILPAALLSRVPAGASVVARPRIEAAAHPVLAAFQGAESGDLGRVSVREWTRCGERSRDAQVLASLDDGSPWLVEMRSDRGRVLILTSSADTGDSDLPLTPLFLPFVHRAVRYLAARDPAERTLEVGQPLSWRLPPELGAAQATITEPGGAPRPLQVSGSGDDRVAALAETRLPGFHDLVAVGANGSASAVFAVNVAAEESRLERAAPAELNEVRAALGAEIGRGREEAASAAPGVTVEKELWPVCVLGALLAFFAEMWILRGFSAHQRAARIPAGAQQRRL